jgi:hypothetical protein
MRSFPTRNTTLMPGIILAAVIKLIAILSYPHRQCLLLEKM